MIFKLVLKLCTYIIFVFWSQFSKDSSGFRTRHFSKCFTGIVLGLTKKIKLQVLLELFFTDRNILDVKNFWRLLPHLMHEFYSVITNIWTWILPKLFKKCQFYKQLCCLETFWLSASGPDVSRSLSLSSNNKKGSKEGLSKDY